jgi:basic amino acid/polyamine antiporter, APA family
LSQQRLKKSITFSQAISIVIGVIIGSGIFLKTGVVFRDAGSPLMGIAAWIIGGIVTLTAALTVAEIASAIPKTGGLYTYLEELYGDVWAFLLGWVQTVIAYPASGAALSIAFATFSRYFVPLDDITSKLLAMGILVFVTAMNILSTKLGGIIQLLSTIGKLIPLIAIIGFGLIKGTANDFTFISSTTTAGLGLGSAILGTLWAYDGWIGVTNIAGELKNPTKNLPKAIFFGVSLVMVVYVLFNLAMLKVLPMEQIMASQTPGADAAVILFGSGAASFITAGILVSVFGALNGYMMTGARVPLAMGERGQLPGSKCLSRIHPSFKTPSNALMLQAALAILYIVSGEFETLTNLTIFTLWIFFTMGVIGIFILRSKKNYNNRGYKVPFYPVVPLIGIVGGIYILYSTVVGSPVYSLTGIGITLLGLPVYFYTKRK